MGYEALSGLAVPNGHGGEIQGVSGGSISRGDGDDFEVEVFVDPVPGLGMGIDDPFCKVVGGDSADAAGRSSEEDSKVDRFRDGWRCHGAISASFREDVWS